MTNESSFQLKKVISWWLRETPVVIKSSLLATIWLWNQYTHYIIFITVVTSLHSWFFVAFVKVFFLKKNTFVKVTSDNQGYDRLLGLRSVSGVMNITVGMAYDLAMVKRSLSLVRRSGVDVLIVTTSASFNPAAMYWSSPLIFYNFRKYMCLDFLGVHISVLGLTM